MDRLAALDPCATDYRPTEERGSRRLSDERHVQRASKPDRSLSDAQRRLRPAAPRRPIWPIARSADEEPYATNRPHRRYYLRRWQLLAHGAALALHPLRRRQ